LLARARQSGVVVTAADEADVLKMVGAIAWAAQDSPAQADRLLALLLNGLRYGDRPHQTGDRQARHSDTAGMVEVPSPGKPGGQSATPSRWGRQR
jgi:hypothetical protein